MPKPQKPFRGQKYFFIDTDFKVIGFRWMGDDIDKKLFDADNIFFDYARAQAVAQSIKTLIQASHLT